MFHLKFSPITADSVNSVNRQCNGLPKPRNFGMTVKFERVGTGAKDANRLMEHVPPGNETKSCASSFTSKPAFPEIISKW